MTAPTKRVRHSGESRNPASLSEGEQREALEVREGPVTPYLAKTKQLRHSREAGNPVLTFGDLTESKIDQGGPPEGDEFVYVDISSVDNKLKRIIEPKMLRVDKAPSRARQRLRVGDVLVSMTRPNLNAVAFVPASLDHSVGSTGFHVLRAREGTESKWLFHAVQSPDFVTTMSALVQGALYPAVRPKEIRAFELEVPPIDEQRRIVAELETQLTRLDASVTALKHVQANLKRYRASVLKAACEGGLVPTEVGAGNWVRKTLGDVARVVGGLTKNPKRAKLSNLMPYLRVANVYANELRLEKIEHIGVADSELEKLLLKAGDLLIVEGNGSKGQIGRVALWDGSIEPCVHQNHLIKVRVTGAAIPKWILFWLLSPPGRKHIEQVSSSTSGLYTLSVGKVASLPLVLPPPAEQHRIVAEVERRFSLIEKVEVATAASLQRASLLRQALLSQSFAALNK